MLTSGVRINGYSENELCNACDSKGFKVSGVETVYVPYPSPALVNCFTPDSFPPPSYEKSLSYGPTFFQFYAPCSFSKCFLINSVASWFYAHRLETVYSDSIRKAELEARLQYLKVSFLLYCCCGSFSLFVSSESACLCVHHPRTPSHTHNVTCSI